MRLANAFTSSAILTLVMTLFVGCGNDDWKITDEVQILSESKSPDGKCIVTVFSCSGGGAAGYTYTNVNLREVSETFDQRDFLLGKHLWNCFTDLSADWKDSETLVVTYRWASDDPDYKAHNGQRVAKKGKVEINYVIKEND
jgi:hypothetical protein